MKITGKTDKGIQRNTNQDNLLYKELFDGISLTIVCDGMGGAKGGLTASTIAVNEISGYIIKNFDKSLTDDEAEKLIIDAVNASNKCIFEKAKNNEFLSGMGTTAVCALNLLDKSYIASVGDSRAYKISGNDITQITKDHSFVQEMVDMGQLSENEAKDHPKKNIITRAIGVEDEIKTDFFIEKFGPDDKLIICSDGLSNMVNDEKIMGIVNEDFDNCCDNLIREANSNGGLDNITITAVLFE